ncbi:hypothetical protein [Elioraea sp.]
MPRRKPPAIPVEVPDRLLQPIGNIPPTEAEERYYAMLDDQRLAA